MRCDQVQERLSEYMENLLDAESYTSVHDHLSSCPHCQAEAQALAQTRQAMADLPSVEPPPGFSGKVMARIREETERPGLWRRLFLPLRIKIPIHTMTILLVGGLAVYLYQVNKPVEIERARLTPSESQPPASVELYSQPPAASPAPSSEGRFREMDEATPTAPGRVEDLRREKRSTEQGTAGILQPEKEAKMEATGKSLAKERPAMKALPIPASPAVGMVDYELTFTPNEPLEGMKVLAPKLEALVEKVGGGYLSPTESSDALKQDLLLKPQTIWLTLPEDRYVQFKTELASLGKIQESSISPEIPSGSMAAPKASQEAPSSLRIKLILQLPEKQK
jgi:hypothetical protein